MKKLTATLCLTVAVLFGSVGISESADLIYHWLLLLKKLDIEPEEVYKELKDRMSS